MPLLLTKLHRPAAPPNPVPRPRLSERLNAGLALGRKLTLISAPAGFGKSTCAAAWLGDIEAPAAWLSLDVADNDPARFFAYVVAALRRIDDTLGAEVAGLLRSGQLPAAEVTSTVLINDIAGYSRPFLLVLDDFQTIHEPVILRVLEHLVTNQPPNLHLVLLSREDPALPLARLRANNQLTEVRAAELRFTGEEVERFLNDGMALNLSAAELAALEAKTEGWAAGLQLAGLSMRERTDAHGFIASLSGSHRYILSYLTEEVLSQQPVSTRRFLLQTSILDRLSGALCDAVTGRTDGAALLEALYARNMFLIPLDDEGHWYRYHHLFADLLRNLQNGEPSGEVSMLHRRASQWYAGEGMLDEAIPHALSAGDYERAGQLLDAHATDLIMQGHVRAVEAWLNVLPPEVRARSPRAELAFSLVYLGRGDITQAGMHLQRVETWFDRAQAAGQEPGLQAQWLALRSFMPSPEGGPAESLALAQRALELAPEGDSTARALAYHALATAHMFTGDPLRVIELYGKAIEYARTAGNVAAAVQAASVLAQVALQIGAYHTAYEVTLDTVTQLERDGVRYPMSATVFAALGHVCAQWHRLAEARRYCERALELCTLGGYGDGEIYCRVQMSYLLLHEQQIDAAVQAMHAAETLLMKGAHPWVQHEAAAQSVRIYLARDQAQAAIDLLQAYGSYFQNGRVLAPAPAGRAITYEEGLLSLSALAVAAHIAAAGKDEEHLHPALAEASELIERAEHARLFPIVLAVTLLRARLHAALGDRVASHADVARAVALAEPEGVITPFVGGGPLVAQGLASLLAQGQLDGPAAVFAQRILDAFPAGDRAGDLTAQASAALLDPLTERELEVLGLVADGCSNQEIADRLFLSHYTVKKHVSNIFSKMRVNRRTQAVALARELGLL